MTWRERRWREAYGVDGARRLWRWAGQKKRCMQSPSFQLNDIYIVSFSEKEGRHKKRNKATHLLSADYYHGA